MATQENRSMVSETSIANQALSWLGAQQITTLDEDSREGRWMKANYPFIRDACLQERNWTFATAKATSTVADLDGWGQMYVHPKPAEWIAVLRVYREVRSGSLDIDDSWRFEQNSVVSRYSTVFLWGLARIVDTGAWPPLFTQVVAARLAAEAAIPLTENRQLQADMWNLYQSKLEAAAARDGQQGANEKIESNRFVQARYWGARSI